MRKLAATVRRLAEAEDGGSMFEYAVMLAGIALLALLAVRAVGGPTRQSIQQTASTFTEALGGAAAPAATDPPAGVASAEATPTASAAVTRTGASAPTAASTPTSPASALPTHPGAAGSGPGAGTISAGS